MSNELTEKVKQNAVLTIWEQQDKVRQMFAPTLTNDEFAFFMGLGKNLQANPFTREIWAIKYDKNQPASVFCGRDFYRRKAQEQPDYEGHKALAVYENDEFEIENGMVKIHRPNLKNPGRLVLAYGILHRKGKHTFFHTVKFSEYAKPFGNWKTMPETMIKKVAEAQTLRLGFQGLFEGTYDESEQWQDAPAPLLVTNEATNLTDKVRENKDFEAVASQITPELKAIFAKHKTTKKAIVKLFADLGTAEAIIDLLEPSVNVMDDGDVVPSE